MPTAHQQDWEYLTVAEYASQLGVAEDKVLAWIHCGELRAVNIAQSRNAQRPRWRIPVAAIEQFERSRETAPPPPKPARRRLKQSADEVRYY